MLVLFLIRLTKNKTTQINFRSETTA